MTETKGMFGNCFLFLFFVLKFFFSIFETKKLIWQPKMDKKTKIVFKTQFVKETENMQNLFSVSNFQKSMKTHI